MHYKIYIKDKPFFLTEELEEEILPYSHHDDAILIDELSSQGLHTALHEIAQEKVHALIYRHSPLEALKTAFWKKFMPIQAAGGLVLDDEGRVLMMFRRNKWDLPKGKVDEGEDTQTAAIREVQEETGIESIDCGDLLLITYHTYNDYGHPMIKETYWYSMKAKSGQALKPQLEEDITEVGFYDAADVVIHCTNTFPSIVDVLKKAKLI